MSFTKDEIIAALKHESSEKKCIYQKYEPACGLWCELKHIWCVDMSNRSAVNSCQEYSPCSSILKAQATLDLITELLTENENLKDILYDADGVNLVNYWYQQCKIAENGCGNFEKENKNLKAENERLKNAYKQCAYERDVFLRENPVEMALLIDEQAEQLKTAKVEAYKECIEKVKNKIDNTEGHIEEDYALRGCWDNKYFYDSEIEDILDNLLKEIVSKQRKEDEGK